MNDQSVSTFVDTVKLFRDGLIYVLLSEDEGDWLERSISDFHIIKDNVDLDAAVILQLERYGYDLFQNNSFKLEQTGHDFILVHVNFREHSFPDRTGTISLDFSQ